MGTRKFWAIIAVAAVAAFGVIWFILSPTGGETVEAIDHTADQMTGKHAFDQGQALREDAKDIRAQQKERLRGIGLGDSPESR